MLDNEILLKLMHRAADLGLEAFRRNHSETALSVGCVIATGAGEIISEGYSREPFELPQDERPHAEAIALEKFYRARDGALPPPGAILFSAIEPCGIRASGKAPCVDRILDAGIRRVYFGLQEPPGLVAEQTGVQRLRESKIELTQLVDPKIYEKIARANPHMRWPSLQHKGGTISFASACQCG